MDAEVLRPPEHISALLTHGVILEAAVCFPISPTPI